MRTYSLRSFILGSLAALASMICLHMPAYADWPAAPGVHSFDLSAVIEHADLKHIAIVRAADVLLVERQALAFRLASVAPASVLKPEYVESYDTHGLNFLKLHLLC